MERVKESEKDFRKGDSGPKYLFRGPKIDWGILVLKPGESLGAHLHREVEETFYFLEGSARMVVGEKKYQGQVGEGFRIEPGEKHDLINDTQEKVKLIFIKCPYLPEDKVSL